MLSSSSPSSPSLALIKCTPSTEDIFRASSLQHHEIFASTSVTATPFTAAITRGGSGSGSSSGSGGGASAAQYPCSYCGKSFLYPSLLIRHVRMHTGERPFPCQLCPYRATSKAHLKRHVSEVHFKIKHVQRAATQDLSVSAQRSNRDLSDGVQRASLELPEAEGNKDPSDSVHLG